MENLITLKGLLSTIVSTKNITINLYDQDGLLIISFGLPGYAALEDELELSTVTKIELISLTTLNITINKETP